ncbi:MAG: hypothetical protein DCF16_03260 [Alphaproteobacteria bacterium]|nr:MAG: hypothetical protein DCF16_03260 [Alphaproteobacteria bacterium]
MHTLLVNGGHVALALIGLWLVYYAERANLAPRAYWGLIGGFSAVAALLLFLVTFPVWIFGDFRVAYYVAGQLAWRGPGEAEGLYAHGNGRVLFVNMPIFSYLFAPFGLVHLKIAMAGVTALNIGAALACWRIIVWLYNFTRRESTFALLAIAMFGPLLYNMREGNTSVFVLLLLLLMLVALRLKRGVAAGVLIAFAVFLKPSLALVAGYFALRGQWRVVAGGLATAIGVTALSVLIFGFDLHVTWYEKSIEPFLHAPVIAAHSVETITAFVARIGMPFQEAVGLWTIVELTPEQENIALTAKLVLLAAIAFAIWRSGRITSPTRDDMEAEIYILFILACLITTTTWAHYYVWMLPAFAYAYTRLKTTAAFAKLRIPLIVSFVLSTPVVFVSQQMEQGAFGPFWNVASSHLLFGGLSLIFILAAMRADFGGAGQSAPPQPAANRA